MYGGMLPDEFSSDSTGKSGISSCSVTKSSNLQNMGIESVPVGEAGVSGSRIPSLVPREVKMPKPGTFDGKSSDL